MHVTTSLQHFHELLQVSDDSQDVLTAVHTDECLKQQTHYILMFMYFLYTISVLQTVWGHWPTSHTNCYFNLGGPFIRLDSECQRGVENPMNLAPFLCNPLNQKAFAWQAEREQMTPTFV